MMDLVLKVTLWSLLYGFLCVAFGIWLGNRLKAMNPTEEKEDLLEWPPYERHL